MSDADFMAGIRSFTGNGASAGVSNDGVITVGRGGYAALIGGTVSNNGQIIVPMGKVALGSGEAATLDLSGDGFLQVAVPTTANGKGALIQNAGSISADGGSVIISAATARDAARNAVNISGLVQATTIEGRGGAIVIGGGEGGKVKVTGKLGGKYALATNLDATSTTYARALIGNNFSGSFDGLGHKVIGLTINATSTDYVGLIGYLLGSNSSVSNIGMVGVSVTGTAGGAAGGLVGRNQDGTVQGSYTTGSVTGYNGTGGLVGDNINRWPLSTEQIRLQSTLIPKQLVQLNQNPRGPSLEQSPHRLQRIVHQSKFQDQSLAHV